jgi:ribosome biogenesis GTPase
MDVKTLDVRIIKGVGGLYTVVSEAGLYRARARGLFRKEKITPLPGDLCRMAVVDEPTKSGYLTDILPRRSELARPRAANVDLVVVVAAAARPDVNHDMLNRLLVNIECAGLPLMIALNKTDLADRAFTERFLADYGRAGYPVCPTSVPERRGVDTLKALMAGKFCVVAGPSGAGKSSLLSAAFPGLALKTGEVSEKIGRGRHTTRHTELFDTGRGFVADTPGFTRTAFAGIRRGELAGCFPEFAPFTGVCRFADCAHVSEPDCAVKAEIGAGVPRERYECYKRFYQELTE